MNRVAKTPHPIAGLTKRNSEFGESSLGNASFYIAGLLTPKSLIVLMRVIRLPARSNHIRAKTGKCAGILSYMLT
jgi:hypothetical protein